MHPRRLFLLSSLAASLVLGDLPSSAAVSAWKTPASYPPDALAKRIAGRGTVHVTTDAQGWVEDARMVRSTGSKVLDDATIQAARTSWTGPANRTADLPVEYRLPTAEPATATEHPGWTIPIHNYPFDAHDAYEQGNGVVRATTDARGNIRSAVIVKSTGFDRLDADAVDNARRHWHGPASSSLDIPVMYRLDHGVPASRPGLGKSWFMPPPNYPRQVEQFHGTGSGVIRISTDGQGRVVRAAMIQSTGNETLDENAVNFAEARWSGPSNSTRTVPLIYRIIYRF